MTQTTEIKTSIEYPEQTEESLYVVLSSKLQHRLKKLFSKTAKRLKNRKKTEDPRLSYPKLTKENLLLILKIHPKPLGKERLLKSFSPSENSDEDIKKYLQELQQEKQIYKSLKNHYTAFRTWSDIAPATLFEKTEKFLIWKNKKLQLKIKGIPEDSQVTVLLSTKQIKKNKLEDGDKVLCHLTRKDGFNLQAKILRKLEGRKPIRLAGYFNSRTPPEHKPPTGIKHTFTSINSAIKAYIPISGYKNQGKKPLASFEHRSVCVTEMPENFDITSPWLRLAKNQWRETISGVHRDDAVLTKHGDRIPSEWPEHLLEEAKNIKLSKALAGNRPMLTGISIDPGKDGVEIDDLIFAQKTPYGFITRVLISDVASLILPGSPLDKEAKKRGNSFYLTRKDINMLPPHISTSLGSLEEGKTRPVICFETKYSRQGKPLQSNIYPANAISEAALTYEQFGEFMNCSDGPKCMEGIRQFQETFVHKMPYNIQEIFQNEQDNYRVTGGSIVETYMLNANIQAASFLRSRNAIFPYRNNGPSLNPEIYNNSREKLQRVGIKLPEDINDFSFERLRDLVIEASQNKSRSMSYIRNILFNIIECASYSGTNCGHFSLGIPYYTHATSPLRRYADLLVQRSLYKEFAKHDPSWEIYAQNQEELENMDETLTHLTEQNALQKNVSRFMKKSVFLGELSYLMGSQMKATINEITSLGISVCFNKQGGLNEIIPTQNLEDTFQIDTQNGCIINKDTGKILQRGMNIKVQVENIAYTGIELSICG